MLHNEIKGPKANSHNVQGVVLPNCNATMCWRSWQHTNSHSTEYFEKEAINTGEWLEKAYGLREV